jgi:3-dehydroquinate synthase class II
MEGGKMVIDIPESLAQKLGIEETRVALENLDQNTAAALLENQKYFETLSPEEIAREQYTATQQLELSVREIATMLKVRFASVARVPLQDVDTLIKGMSDYINPVNKKSEISSYLESITNPAIENYKKYINNAESLSSVKNRPQKIEVDYKVSTKDVDGDPLSRQILKNPNFATDLTNKLFNNSEYDTPTFIKFN